MMEDDADILDDPAFMTDAGDTKTTEAVRNHDRIYETVMRGGGEPFGRPFEDTVSTLRTNIVQRFHQKGFFGFATFERAVSQRRRNRFTRYGAVKYRPPKKSDEGDK